MLFAFVQIILSSELKTDIDKKTLSVGERLHFVVTAFVPKGAVVTPPQTENGFGNIVVKEWTTNKGPHENLDSIAFSYVITTYVPERCTIPSLPYVVQNGTTVDTLHSAATPLEFQSVITAETVDIKDLKPQQIAGKAPQWWIWTLIGIIIVCVAIILFKRFTGKKSAADSAIPLLPPYEEAIAAIHELERNKFLQRGLLREYVFNLSEILKRYVERRFSVNASEFTTEEMLAWLGISCIDEKLKKSIEWFFKTSDPVKFARQIPDETTLDRFMKETMDFLNATRPVLQAQSVSESAKQPATENTTQTTSATSPVGVKNEV
jgi:hypothetical protein